MKATLRGCLALCVLHSGVIFAHSIETIDVVGTTIDTAKFSGHSALSRLDIEQINPSSTVELLRHIPNILVSQNAQGAGPSFIGVRGGEANFTLVMIDNIIVNDPTNSRGGGFDFNQLSVQSIERVEVYRGGVAAIYGSEAISGVIHFITRNATESQATLNIAAGNNDYSHISLNLSAVLSEQTTALLNVSKDKLHNSPVANASATQALFKLNHRSLKWNHQLTLLAGKRQSSALSEDSGGELFANPYQAEQRDSKLFTAGYGTEFSSDSKGTLDKITASMSWHHHREDVNNPGISDGVYSGIPASVIASEYKRLEAQVSANWNLPAQWQLVTGISRREATGSNAGYLDYGFQLPVDFVLEQDTNSLFSQLSGQVAKVAINLGLRYEDPTGFASDLSSRVALDWAVNDQVNILANYSEGYKLPSFFALAHPLIGNQALKPEASENSDITVRYQASKDVSVEVSYFENQYTDLVDFDPEIFKSVNRSAVDVRGVEFVTQGQFNEWFDFQFDVAYNDTQLNQGHAHLRRRPQWFAGAVINASWQQFSANLTSDYRDHFYDSSIATGERTLSGYTVWHLSGQWQVNQALRLRLNIDNIFDKQFQQSVGFVDKGRKFRVGVSYTI